MERLTYVDRISGMSVPSKLKYDKNMNPILNDDFVKIIKKLAYYEELEESGKLLELPYPVGTPLFIPCRKQGVKQDHIRRWQTNNKGLMFCSNGSFYLADAIGKSVFLTREEAEVKLIEREK